MTVERERPNSATRAAEDAGAHRRAGSDWMPTEDEKRDAERQSSMTTCASTNEMAEQAIKGEGRIS
jgi:hypothetical protein